jgi:hypothetical protein
MNERNPNVSELEPGATGFYLEDQDHDAILSMCESAECWFESYPETFTYPDSVNALDWVVTENQMSIGSCAGFGATTVGEGVHWLGTGESLAFSPWAQFAMAQQRDGIRGDRGSTIQGNIWVMKNIGLVPKSICPAYPKSYNQGWPVTDEMKAAAKQYRIPNSVDVRGYDNSLKFLQSGQGFVYHGSIWTKGMDAPGFKIHDFFGPRRNDRHGGGHSTCFVGWTEELCPCCGTPYLILHNSWSKRWGDDGAKMMCRKAYDDMSGHKATVLQGISDVPRDRGPRLIRIDANDWV